MYSIIKEFTVIKFATKFIYNTTQNMVFVL